MKLWSGRFGKDTDALVNDFNASIQFDQRLYKEDITGFVAEAWHFRYVGTEHSLIMRDENLCLEEYTEKYGPAAE